MMNTIFFNSKFYILHSTFYFISGAQGLRFLATKLILLPYYLYFIYLLSFFFYLQENSVVKITI